jgi:glycerophosphoryl diester phosphodiesterase
MDRAGARPGRTPLIYGHRGAGRDAVIWAGGTVWQNTVASFAAAVASGADGIELDAARTRDGKLVVHHDSVLGDRLTLIESLTLAEARSHGLVTLQEAFDAIPAHVPVIVDVKSALGDADLPVAETTVGLTAGAVGTERSARGRELTTYTFDPSGAAMLSAELAGTGVRVGYIADRHAHLLQLTIGAARMGLGLVAAHTTSFLGPTAVDQQRPYTLPQLLAAGHERGLQYLAWCPTPQEAAALAAAGVDAVCVDDTPLAVVAIRDLC